MKITYRWLTEHLKTSWTAQELVDVLTLTGSESSVIEIPSWSKNFYVAKIQSVQQHPQADSLSICQVLHKNRTLTIVCGAKNVRDGLLTMLALPGSYLPNAKQPLEKAVLRGITSEGMLCSATELALGLPCPANGIIELPSSFQQDTTLDQILNKDPVLDVEITPNRGDLLSARGLARELSALGAGHLLPLPTNGMPVETQSPFCPVHIEVDPSACQQFYTALCTDLKNIPAFMTEKLVSVGLKTISPVVDLTNYIAHDLGQPLHAFDADMIKGSMTLRFSKEAESFEGLDGQNYILPEGILVLADQGGVISLPGILGGHRTALMPHTKRVLLEAALFDPAIIARAGQLLKIFSQARFRAERGLDSAGVLPAFKKALSYMEHPPIHKACAHEKQTSSISLHSGLLPQLTGVTLETADIRKRLENLGCVIKSLNNDIIDVTPPSWRNDWSLPETCIEEIVRYKGYQEISSTPLMPKTTTLSLEDSESRGWQGRRFFAQKGVYEVVTWSFMGSGKAELFLEGGAPIILSNPLSQDLSTMRPSVLPNLLDLALYHRHHAIPFQPIFEWGPLFFGSEPGQQEDVITAIFPCKAFSDWQARADMTFFDVKSLVEDLFKIYHLSDVMIDAQTPSYYHPGRSARFFQKDTTYAVFGQIHPRLHKLYPDPMWAIEIFLSRLPAGPYQKKAYHSNALQPVEKDLSFSLSEKIPVGPFIKALSAAGGKTLISLQLMDLFVLTADKKSITLRCTFQPTDHTFTEETLHLFMDQLIQCAKGQGAELRGMWT